MSGEWHPNMDMGPVGRRFFSDESIESVAQPADYADWAPGPNENPERVTRKRPSGDMSFINWKEDQSE